MNLLRCVYLIFVGAMAVSESSPQQDSCTEWPVFHSEAELQADNWGKYFNEVYGELPQEAYPLRVGDYWMFYDDFLQKSGAKAPEAVGECPVHEVTTTTLPSTTGVTTTSVTTITTTTTMVGWVEEENTFYSDILSGQPVHSWELPHHDPSTMLNLGSFNHSQQCQAACQRHDACHSYTWNLTFRPSIYDSAFVPNLCIGSTVVGKRQGYHCGPVSHPYSEHEWHYCYMAINRGISGHDSHVTIVDFNQMTSDRRRYPYPGGNRRRHYPGPAHYKLATACTRYTQNNAYQPAGVSWSWHPPHFSGHSPAGYSFFDDNSWIEVAHKRDPWNDESHGMWLLYAKGSGIWFNIGKSLRCGDHDCALQSLINVPMPNWTLGDATSYGHERMSQDEMVSDAACAAGITSLQFNKHFDTGNYPTCQPKTGTYMNIEIVATCYSGTYACGVANAKGNPFKAGWHSKPCACTNDADVLNCGHHTKAEHTSPHPHPGPTASPRDEPPTVLMV